jgi:broad specificity phosphatase PhoE
VLYLVRHGQTDWNLDPQRCQGWTDVPLNDTGREQARRLGRELRGRGIETVVTSDLARARETAELAREELDPRPPLTVDPRLAETDRGTWEGRSFPEIKETEPEVWADYRERPETFRYPGGESLAEQQRRVLEAVRDAALSGRVALLVTHGGSIRLVRAFVEGRGIESFHELKMANGAVVEIDEPGLAARIAAFLHSDDLGDRDDDDRERNERDREDSDGDV